MGSDTITFDFNPTDDRIIDATTLIKEVLKTFWLDTDEQDKVLKSCLPCQMS